MSDDNLLAGVLGALEGFNRAYLPYQQAQYQDAFATKRRRQQQEEELAMLPIKEASEIRIARAKQVPEVAEVPIRMTSALKMADSGQRLPVNAKILDDTIDERAEGRQGERRERLRGDLISKFNADTNVKKSNQAIDAASNIVELLNSGNPLADGAVPTFMARASGEVGALSEADKAPFGGSQALQARMKQVYEKAVSGKLTDENRQFVRQLAETMQKAARKNMAGTARRYGKQYSQISGYGTDKEIFGTLAPGMEFEEQPEDNDPLGLGF